MKITVLGPAALLALACVSQLRADLFVAGQISATIQRYEGVSGAPEGDFVPSGQTYSPFQATGVTFGPDGNLYVVSTADGEILRYNGTTGAPMPGSMNSPFGAEFTNGAGMSGAQYVTFGPDALGNPNGDIYATWMNHVNQYNAATGALLNTFTLNTGSGGQLSGIAVGPNGNLYVANRDGSPLDNFANSVIQLNPVTGFAASATITGLNSPAGLTFHNGDLYIALPNSNTLFNGEVIRYDPASNSTSIFVSPSANIFNPQGIVFGPDGNLYLVSSALFGQAPTFVERYNGTTGADMGVFALGSQMDTFFGLAFSNPTAVPEPSTWTAGLAVVFALLAHRRGRFRRV